MYANSGTHTGRFGYGGAYGYQEEDSGLKLLGHRFYDPDAGRFLTRDTAGASTNLFTYCDNNPLKFVDADGLKKRALTASERRAVQKEITRIAREDPARGKVLQGMLDDGRILADDDLADYGVTIGSGEDAEIVLNGMMLQHPALFPPAWLLATLFHEGIHASQGASQKGVAAEIEANEKTIAFLRKLLKNPNLTAAERHALESQLRKEEALLKDNQQKLKGGKKIGGGNWK